MMNKMKSGFLSKAKAVIALPIILVAFFLIADLSCSTDPETINNISEDDISIELPTIAHARTLDEIKIAATIIVTNKDLLINNETIDADKLEDAVKSIAANIDKNTSNQTILLEIDQSTKMSKVDDLRQALRNNELYKIAFKSVSGDDSNTETIQGLPQKLPPLDAILLDDEGIKKEGIIVYTINIFDNLKSTNTVKNELRELIETNDKYVIKQMHSDETTYGNFMKYTDLVYETVFGLRDEMAQQKWGVIYADLEKDKQEEIWKKYPMTLMSLNIDSDLK